MDVFEGGIKVLEGNMTIDFPAVIIDVEFARKAMQLNELPLFVDQAIKAMELSGQQYAFIRETE